MNTYGACLLLIQRKSYKSKEDISFKLNIFLLNDQLNEIQYNELMALVNAH
ncbi:hypothetical protein NSQ62_07665 [Solibacillus sp. FSL H8-0523]|uniref:hypothetical protein n=1 Tax=Solibacillus sp. FSL H8-0523 TaxID=2954511 RepID=UPI00310128AF